MVRRQRWRYGPAMSLRRSSELCIFSVVLVTTSGCRSILGIEQTEVDPASCELLTQRIFFADKLVSDKTIDVGMISQARFEQLAEAVGATLDPGRGHGLAEVVDCDDEPAEYAAADFEPSGAGITSFVVEGDKLVLGTDTGVEGVLGVLNLDTPEELLVTAYPDEVDVESSAGDILTQAGELSRIRLSPNSEVMVTPPSVDEWSCVGTIAEPEVSDPTITLTVDVQESSAFVPSGLPIEGVRVAACLSDPSNCAAGASVGEGQSAVTDSSGRAQLVVSTGDQGFDGHLVISGVLPSCGE